MFANLFKPRPESVDERTPEQIERDRLRVELQYPAELRAYVLKHADENGDVRIPVEGTMTHLWTVQSFLNEGGQVIDFDMHLYQDTADYSERMIEEIKRLIINRITNGYPGDDYNVDENDSPYEAAQRICGRFLVGLRGFTVITADGRRINTVSDWQF